jgi:signal transduction histidine kinase
MRKIQLLLLLFISLNYAGQAINQVDSLRRILDTTHNEEKLVALYYDIGRLVEHESTDSAIIWYRLGFKYAKKNGFLVMQARYNNRISYVISMKGNYAMAIDTAKSSLVFLENEFHTYRANVFNTIGVNYYNLSEYDSARFYWSKALAIHKHNKDSAGMGTSFVNLGVADFVQSKYESALQNFIYSLELRQKHGSKRELGSIYMKLALIYNQTNDQQKAYLYLKEAIQIYRKIGDNLAMAKAMVNLSNTYELLDSVARAGEMLIEAQKIGEEVGNRRFLGSIYTNLSSFYTNTEMYDTALNYSYRARDIYQELGQKRELSITYYKMGQLFFQIDDYDAAIAYFQSAWDIMIEIDNYEWREEVLDYLAQTYAKKNNYKEAYLHQLKYIEVKDTLALRDSRGKLQELEARFNKKQQEQRIEILKKQKQLDAAKIQKSISTRNLLFLIIALVISTVVLIYLKYRQKSYLNNALREQNNEVKLKNSEIGAQSEILQEVNSILMQKNELIEKQKNDLEEHNKTKDRLFSIIGHDLRSPIASIYSTVALMKIKQMPHVKQQELLAFVQNSLKATLELLENLMLWAKSQEQGIEMKKVETSINSIIQNTIEGVGGVAKEKGVSISFDTDQEYTAMVDSNMIGTVLRNLLTNAIKFSHEGGGVEVSVKPQNDRLRISVLDHGVGMDKETITKVFNGKEHFSTRGTHKERGAGLGLVLVHSFIEKHGGALVVESEVGKGSEFSFTITVN